MADEKLSPLASPSHNADTEHPRRNSSISRFHVTPSTSDFANFDSPPQRKASAPVTAADSNGFHSTELNVDPTSTIRSVQFDVGEDDGADDTVGTASGAETTITANLKSWRRMQTLDHPPLLDFYRNSTDGEGIPSHRPSMLELLNGAPAPEFDEFRDQNVQIVDQQLAEGSTHSSTPSTKHNQSAALSIADIPNPAEQKLSAESVGAFPIPTISTKIPPTKSTRKKFGWIEGVFFRCVLNIFGVILYLRVSWVAGQTGVLLGCAVVLLASVVTTITALSTCAICTNGEVKGGGVYFLISRSLGPEFGGSIGLIFSVANAVAAAMYVVGFAETVRDLLHESGIALIDGGLNDVRLVGLVTCCVLVAIVFIGTGFESKMQMGLLVILLLSICDYFAGAVLPPNSDQLRRGITGLSANTLKENLLPSFRAGHSFFSVFSIYFPAATGIMAGANISGDLADPQRAIPLGTLISIAFTTLIYLGLVMFTGSSVVRDADGFHLPLLIHPANSTPPLGYLSPTAAFASYWPPECSANNTCPYGLLNYFQVIEVGSLWGPLITAGIFAASLSSALASLVSAPKIFQAVCKDPLFPYITYFGKGFGKNDEPRRGYAFAFLLSMLIVLVGDLNAIAPIISNFFLCSYALINYACFDNSFAHSPGFRPAFRYYNMWISLLGAVLCVTVMFIVSWFTALLTFFFFALLFLYISHRKPDVNWGSSTQAHSYRNALHAVSRLEHIDEHVKNYRPQILVLTGNPAARPSLVDFVGNITKENSLMICGYVVPYNPSDQVMGMVKKLNDQLRTWLKKRHIKSFYMSVANPSLRAGVQSLIQCTGLGRLRPNVLALGFKQNWLTDGWKDLDEYFGVIQDAFDGALGVIILRTNTGGLDFSDSMKTHNVGDTSRLRLPEMTVANPQLRPNQSERSLTGAAAAAAASPFSTSLSVESGALRIEPKPPLERTESTFCNSNQSSFRDSQLEAEEEFEDDESCSDTEAAASEIDDKTEAVDVEKQSKAVNFKGAAEAAKEPEGLEKRKLLPRRRKEIKRQIFGLGSRRMTAAQRELLSSINRFQRKVKKGIIDVWWLYDDGGLALLIPYLISQPKSYLEHAQLRVFTISTSASAIEQEHRNMVALLSKFRISFSDITVIPDVGRKPRKETIDSFNHLIEPFRGDDDPTKISDADLASQKDRTMRQLRVSELLRHHSLEADLIVLSMPIPRRGITKPALYMAWLDIMTKDLPTTLLVRGNQTSVLTFYS